jgi:hypothetical protein
MSCETLNSTFQTLSSIVDSSVKINFDLVYFMSQTNEIV